MATNAAVRQFRRAQSDIVQLAERELDAFWRTLDKDNPIAAVRALELFMPDVIQAYGEIGAAVAMDFYDELRDNAQIRGAYRAVLGDAIPIEQARASTRWAAGPFFKGDSDPQQVLSNLTLVTDRYVKQQARNTITVNALRDPAQVRYARVPTGDKTCAFCLAMASRGAVYANETSASNTYHGGCDCVPTPIWSERDYPSDYHPDKMRDLYDKAKSEAESNGLKGSDGILSALRQQQGIS